MTFADTLAILAGIISLLAYVTYNAVALKDRSKTLNLGTVLLWTAMSAISALTYLAGTGDIFKASVPLANMFANLVTLRVTVWLGGSFRKLNTGEKRMILVGFLAILGWKLANPMLGNYIVIIAVSVSVIPIFRDVLANPRSQHWLPWFLWTTAFGLQTVVVALKFDGHYGQFAQPLIYGILHGAIWGLSLRKQ